VSLSRRIAIALLLTVIALVVGYPAVWIVASQGVFGDVELGYYKGFNIAKHAIERSGCAESIEYGGVNKDLFLEEFHFKVTTPSGRRLRLWFDASNMNVRRLCYKPVGLIVIHEKAHEEAQMYSVQGLSRLLKGSAFGLGSLTDLLCNIDELEKILIANPGDANDVLRADPHSWNYLRIEFPRDEDLLDEFMYWNIKEQDVANLP
jgi:hypothetical protein